MSATKEQLEEVNRLRKGHMAHAKGIFGDIPHEVISTVTRDNDHSEQDKELGRFHNQETERVKTQQTQFARATTRARQKAAAAGFDPSRLRIKNPKRVEEVRGRDTIRSALLLCGRRKRNKLNYEEAPITKPETTYQAVGIIRPEDVAKKLAAIRNHEYPVLLEQLAAQPRLAELMWFLQYTSMQPGGLVKFCADMFTQLPARFGTETMRAAKRPEYTLQEKRSIYGEIPYRYNPVGIKDPDAETADIELLWGRIDRLPPSEEEKAGARRESSAS